MPRFFFHVRDGEDIEDKEGVVLADIPEARRQAIITAGSMLSEEADRFRSGKEWTMEVVDETKTIVCKLAFTVVFNKEVV